MTSLRHNAARYLAPMLLALCASPALAQQSLTFDAVAEAVAAGENGSISSWKKVLLREVLVTTKPEVDDSEFGTLTFHVSDFERVGGVARVIDGESIRVSLETLYYGVHLFDENNDDPYDTEVDFKVKKGDVITIAGRLSEDDDDVWVLSRDLESDLWDDDLYETYADGFSDVEDFGYAMMVLGRNWGLDDIADFRTDAYLASSDLDEFNDFLVANGLAKIVTTDDVDDRNDEVQDLDHGLHAVITIHEGNVQPVLLQPSIVYVRPYGDLRQDSIVVIKVNNAGLFPKLLLGRRRLAIQERLPGMLIAKMPRHARTGRRPLRIVNEAGVRSAPFPIWIKIHAPANNPAPVLKSATVVGSPGNAVLVLEGEHFRQEGDLRVYLGRRRLPTVIRRESGVVIAKIPAGFRGKVARVRVGRQVSGSRSITGGRWLSTPAPSSGSLGAAGVLGALGQ